jgi:hypothetical protein
MSQSAFTPEKPTLFPQGPATSGKAIFALILGLLSLGCACAAGLPAILLGVLALGDIKRSPGTLRGGGLAIAGIALGVFGTLLGSSGAAIVGIVGWQVHNLGKSNMNLKQIGIGLHNYHDVFNSFPLIGAEETPPGINMSWRVRMLPYIEQRMLYERVNFSEPWNGPSNTILQNSPMPGVYAVPPAGSDERNTSYLVFTTDDIVQHGQLRGEPMFGSFRSQGRGRAGIADCPDGTSNTILVVEADRDRAVHWVRPQDLKFDPANPKAGLGQVRSGGFIVVMGDGAVRFLPNSIDEEVLRRLVLRNDGHAVTP